MRECEGTLIGPIRSTVKAGTSADSIYVHRNCAIWAPEVFQDEVTGKLMGVHDALARAKRFKCVLCGGSTPSLSCMFQNTACCRAMHFRCALLQGATLVAGFQTFCPRHRTRSAAPSGVGPPPSIELHYDRTPVDEALIGPGSGCKLCNGDSYNPELGSILTCSSCSTRHHSKCMWPDLEADGGFSGMSWQGKYLCKACMRCVSCDKSVDKDAYDSKGKGVCEVEQGAFDEGIEAEGSEPDCDTVICVGCNHFACHIACLPEGSTPELWRCQLCLVCKHCNAANIPRQEWNESCEACEVCAEEIRRGGVVCPICVKVYREGENIPMVQCDYCDRWIHARKCAGLSEKEFQELTDSDHKYRCPLCEKEKVRRELDRRRSKGSNSRHHINGIGLNSARAAVDLEPILNQMPLDEHEMTFHSVRRVDTECENFTKVFKELAPDAELCRRCCSGGQELGLLFCIDCGESYHEFCQDSSRANLYSRSRAAWRNSQNGCAIKGQMWRCFECERFIKSRIGYSTHINGDYTTSSESAEDSPQLNGLFGEFTHCNGTVHEDARNGVLYEPEVTPCTGDEVAWGDLRKCEFCEHREDPRRAEGRLIPWASITDSNDSHCWIHVGCVIWSVGVTLHGSRKYDVVLAPRKRLLRFARQTSCRICKRRGATLRCLSPGCSAYFHFGCAMANGVGCIIVFKNELQGNALLSEPNRRPGAINIADIRCVQLLCRDHAAARNSERERILDLKEAHSLINLRRVVKIFDTTDFSKDFEPPKKKLLKPGRLLSLRVGSLSVLQFGRLVPEVNDFIVKGCLVPYGYCATRRFWSMVHPWKRCVYFLEVCGYPETGPEFVIRCSDNVSERIVSKDPDEAWGVVTKRIMEMRKQAYATEVSRFSIHTTGLEAFGLAHCVPVVTQVESLPMASMFNGRYMLKRVATHRSNEVIFYNSLAKKFEPVQILENSTGCARSEGYVSAQGLEKHQSNAANFLPTYENARTGAAFQLQVAREISSRNEYVAPKRRAERRFKQTCALESKSISAEDRSRTNKSTPKLPLATQHRYIASTSRARTIILRSDIDGCGVFATRDIQVGEMIIEYVGEIIRPILSDLREVRYLKKGIGCYMFQIEPGLIVDATVCGNAARYINHSCAPNCYSRTIATDNDRKVVVIFAKRNIQRGEELTYDYLFPYDDADRVKCGCGTDQCKGWMN